MTTSSTSSRHAPHKKFQHDLLAGLRQSPKRIPSRYFYDARGSELFDAICELEEYYPTRTEISILKHCVGDLSEHLGPRCQVIEYGAGSGVKTQWLLDALVEPVAYVPIEISQSYLRSLRPLLEERFPDIEILPLCGDFAQPLTIPEPARSAERRITFFPGSTIGNFQPADMEHLLKLTAERCGPGGKMVVGLDLKKDRPTLEAAYDDSLGVTAEFNLNLLRRANRELDADFELEAFEHRAFYNESAGRIEMHLESMAEQKVVVEDHTFEFEDGERILTEYSYKYELEDFSRHAARCGMATEAVWTDERRYCAVVLLTVRHAPPRS